MKVVVEQSLVGNGYLSCNIHDSMETKAIQKFISNCMKSVKSWCNKRGYQYVLTRKDLGWNYFEKRYLNEINTKPLGLGFVINDPNRSRQIDMCAQRHQYWLDIDADYIIGIDNDVWVYEDFEFPKVEELGLCINRLVFAHSHHTKYEWITEIIQDREKTHKINQQRKKMRAIDRLRKAQHGNSYYPNGGVQIISRNANKHYNEWIVNSIKSDNWPPRWFRWTSESFVYEYTRQFPEKITWLDYRYNCIPGIHTKEEVKNCYLVHFAGSNKTGVFTKLPKDMQKKFYEKK